MAKKKWRDPIVEEVRAVRKQFDRELKHNPKGFLARARKRAIELGFKLIPPPADNEKPAGSGKKKSG